MEHVGPGLAIRVICQSSPHIHDDFSPTNSLLAHIVTFYHACRQFSPITASIEKLISKDERDFLLRLTERNRISATLLPIYSVGVQVSAKELEVALMAYRVARGRGGRERWGREIKREREREERRASR